MLHIIKFNFYFIFDTNEIIKPILEFQGRVL